VSDHIEGFALVDRHRSADLIPWIFKVDVPDPVAEEGPVKGKSTEGSDDED
jgi:hypothetical protein